MACHGSDRVVAACAAGSLQQVIEARGIARLALLGGVESEVVCIYASARGAASQSRTCMACEAITESVSRRLEQVGGCLLEIARLGSAKLTPTDQTESILKPGSSDMLLKNDQDGKGKHSTTWRGMAREAGKLTR